MEKDRPALSPPPPALIFFGRLISCRASSSSQLLPSARSPQSKCPSSLVSHGAGRSSLSSPMRALLPSPRHALSLSFLCWTPLLLVLQAAARSWLLLQPRLLLAPAWSSPCSALPSLWRSPSVLLCSPSSAARSSPCSPPAFLSLLHGRAHLPEFRARALALLGSLSSRPAQIPTPLRALVFSLCVDVQAPPCSHPLGPFRLCATPTAS
jgi:hypothetical protein